MAAAHKWMFKPRFRTRAFGWRASKLAIGRLGEAASEIKKAARTNPLVAGEGVVILIERIWPAFQDIDTSSGALGGAVSGTINDLIPILVAAPTDRTTRARWLDRLFQAVQDDGVEYLSPIADHWGEIAQYPEFMNEYADRMIGLIRHAWSSTARYEFVQGTTICLSCLLEAGRYEDLQDLLAIAKRKYWYWHRFGADALARQGLWQAAISFAENCRDPINPGYYQASIDRFCEKLMIQHGHSDDAYRIYGLASIAGTTNLATYRAVIRAYPDRDHRQILLDLIETRGDKGKWFAAAKSAGFLDIAMECAAIHGADPSTLVRAARDFCAKEPEFAAAVALLALRGLLSGEGYDPSVAEVDNAIEHLVAASRRLGALDWARQQLDDLVRGRCATGRELFQHALIMAISRWLPNKSDAQVL